MNDQELKNLAMEIESTIPSEYIYYSNPYDSDAILYAVQKTWQAACEYKDEQIDILINHDIAGYKEGIDCLTAQNKKLREALEFTILAAEQLYQPHRPLERDLCPTFYFTLSYEGDLELIERCKQARKILDEVEDK